MDSPAAAQKARFKTGSPFKQRAKPKLKAATVEKRPVEWGERAHMIFNWLSSAHQNRATNEEVLDWFRDCGFEQMKVSAIPVGITGTKRVRP